MLESYIAERRRQKPILLMTHIVIGYPSFSASHQAIDQMVEAGVDLIELQIPFSEPLADGPVIAHANQLSLANGATLDGCFEFAAEVAARHPIPFLFMSYYNLIFKAGAEHFLSKAAKARLTGMIVPDLPPEEGSDYLKACEASQLDPIFIFSPRTTAARLASIAQHARGFLYCVARIGITGQKTEFSEELTGYLARCRKATSLPLAVGFGIKNCDHVRFLQGKADIAVVGSETIRIMEAQGAAAIGPFIAGLSR